MTELRLNIDETTLRSAVGDAILAQLSEEGRAEIIKQAIAYILTPKDRTGGYSYERKSPLQSAFEMALDSEVHRIAREFVETDEEIRTALQEKLRDIAGQVLADSDVMNRRLADGLVHALSQMTEPRT